MAGLSLWPLAIGLAAKLSLMKADCHHRLCRRRQSGAKTCNSRWRWRCNHLLPASQPFSMSESAARTSAAAMLTGTALPICLVICVLLPAKW